MLALGLVAEWAGTCRACGRPCVERVEITWPAPPPRSLSDAERADPALVAARVRMAALFEADGLRLDTIREYRDMVQRSAQDPAPVNRVVHQSLTKVGDVVHEIRPE